MFEVLAFVYENYWAADSCPELPTLQRTLNAVGFADHEVIAAMVWLEELRCAAHREPSTTGVPGTSPRVETTPASQPMWEASAGATRVFSDEERARLGVQGWGLLIFLKDAGALNGDRLERVLERVLATPGNTISLEDLKLVVLMVYWSLGEEPDALVLDELCESVPGRLAN